MTNRTLPEFWRLYEALPAEIQDDARRAFNLFRDNPSHPSLHFKPLQGRRNVWSVRAGLHYRAVGQREGGTLRWFWIGRHADFDREFS